MSRSQRLLALLEELRRHRRPVRGAALAEALGVSLRTLYRDIATLSAQGAAIAGEAGEPAGACDTPASYEPSFPSACAGSERGSRARALGRRISCLVA